MISGLERGARASDVGAIIILEVGIVTWLWLIGCAASGDGTLAGDPCVPGDEATLELGTGETAFEPVEAGGFVELVHGPQGGFHTYVGFAATGLDASSQWTAEIEGTLGGELLAESAPFLTMRCDHAEGRLEAWGTQLIWDAQPEDLDGQPITVTAWVTDASGLTLSDTIDLVIEDPLL